MNIVNAITAFPGSDRTLHAFPDKANPRPEIFSAVTAEETEMPRSTAIQSERARRRSPTSPAIVRHPERLG